MSVPLSQALREHTDAAHREAEETTFVADLLAGSLDATAYRALLAQNHAIYDAFEAQLDQHADNPHLSGILDRRLDRLGALEADLDALVGPSWRSRDAAARGVVTETQEYAAALTARGSDPMFILGQHYVRYLGDLSGGQIIATMVGRHYGIDRAALSFYDFPLIGKGKPYKDAYRSELDAIGEQLSSAQRTAALGHAADAFEFNRQVFLGLQARLGDRDVALV